MKKESKLIEIKKEDKKYIIIIKDNIPINDFIQIINNQYPSLLSLININLLINKEKNEMQDGICHVVLKKDTIYNLCFFQEEVKLSKKEKKDDKIIEEILTWNSETNNYKLSIYLDTKERKRILLKTFNSNIEYDTNKEIELTKRINKLLNDFKSIGYKIPLEYKLEKQERILR